MVTNPKIILLLMTQKKLPKKFLGPGKEELKEIYKISINDKTDLDYILFLIKQKYKNLLK
jgi:hypothetical protein